MNDILKIAIGVFIGALAAGFAWEGINALVVQQALKEADQQMQGALKLQNEEQRQRQQELANRQRLEQQRAQQWEEQQQEQMKLSELRRQDKEAAFKRFYQPTPSCKADSSQMECANAYMRAKTTFESQYVPTR